MKSVSQSDLQALAGQLERTARILRTSGPEAVRRARDWATPLRSSGSDPGRGKGQISRPTETAALSEFHDPTAEELTLLSSEAGRCFDAVTTLESRVLRIATDAVIENQRAGIGTCEDCHRYCQGQGNDRLRLGLCDACRKRAERKEAKAEVCDHKRSTRWVHGEVSCADCGTVLEQAVSQ